MPDDTLRSNNTPMPPAGDAISSEHPDLQIASPCIRQCCLDEQDICLGCKRSLAEICAWSTASNTEKQTILQRCADRRAASSRRVTQRPKA